MNNLSNSVDKYHDLLLQNFCGISEIPDITKSENSTLSFSRQHRIEITLLSHILGYDLTTRLSKSQSQKHTDFGYCVLDDQCLVCVLITYIVQLLVFRR